MLMAAEIKLNLEHYLGQASAVAELPDPSGEWVIVLIRPGYEQQARDSLRRRGIGAWWPNYQKEVGTKDPETGKRYKRLIRFGVLPGVLLSPAKMDERFWSACDLAPGVINVARNSSTGPILLTDVDIALIHAIETGLNRADPVKAALHSYETGERVRFIDDEYRRLPTAKVIRCDRDGEITVEVNFFGRMTKITVMAFQIEPVDVKPPNQTASRSTDARDRPAKSPRKRR